MKRFVVFDLETTGFSSMTCDVVQFAYCEFDANMQLVKAENLYFYYEGMSWSQEAADASHHLTLDYLRKYKDDFRANVLKMYSILNRSNVCGHNSNNFDCPFAKNWLARMGLTDFEFGIKQDTMIGLRPLHKRPRIKLTKLADMCDLSDKTIRYVANMWFGSENIRGPHDAAYDVTMTALLTMKGLRDGYMSFDFNDAHVVEVTEDSLDFVDSETAEKDVPVALVIFENTGRRTYPCRPDDKPKDLPLPDGSYWEFPEPLPMTEPYKGVMVNLRNSGNEEWLEIVTPYVTVDSRITDTLPLLQSLYKEE